MTVDRDLLIKAAMVGFSVSREGFNGGCAYDHLRPRLDKPSRKLECSFNKLVEIGMQNNAEELDACIEGLQLLGLIDA